MNKLIQQLLGLTGDNSSPVGSETDKWKANRIAQNISDLSKLTELNSIVDKNEDAGERRMAYRIYGFLASNTQDPKVIEELLKHLKEEKNEDALYELLMAVNDADLPYSNETDTIASWADDLNEMVRNASIRALGKSLERESAEKTLIAILESPYDEFGIRFAADSLYNVGSLKSIPILESSLLQVSNEDTTRIIHRTILKLQL